MKFYYIIFFVVDLQDNKVVLITGCSSGFGLSIAKTLAESGYVVYASMRGITSKNSEIATDLRNWSDLNNLRLNVVEMDVSDFSKVRDTVQKILKKEGKIDVLVNNAGIAAIGLMESFSPKQVEQLFKVNLYSPINLINEILPSMRKRNEGLIINISSTASRVCFPYMGIYCATKASLEMVTDSYRKDLKDFNIDLVSIQPGAFSTNIGSNMISPESENVEGYESQGKLIGDSYSGLYKDMEGSQEDANLIAYEIKEIIESTDRPLRKTVGEITTDGIDEVNSILEKTLYSLEQSLKS